MLFNKSDGGHHPVLLGRNLAEESYKILWDSCMIFQDPTKDPNGNKHCTEGEATANGKRILFRMTQHIAYKADS